MAASFFTDGLEAQYEAIGDAATIGSDTYYGIYEREFVEIENVQGYMPTFRCSVATAALVDKGDSMTIDSTTLKVVRKEPIHPGEVLIILEK